MTCAACFNVTVKPAVTSLTPTSAARGASGLVITISGSGFQPGLTVAFAGTGVTATVVSVTSTSINVAVDVAAGAATGNRSLTVTNPDAGTVTRATGLRIT